jgi:F0F1-type ATP synthase assembly protein I
MARNFESDSAQSNKALQDTLDRSEPRIFAAYGLIGAILLFGALGYGVDRWAHTSPWFLLTGLLVGIVLGFYTLVTAVRGS